MKLSLITEDIHSKLPILIKQFYNNIDQTKARNHILQISELDPTINKQYTTWLIKQVKLGNIRIPEDNEKIHTNLTNFHKLKQKLPVKDINQYNHPADITKALELITPSNRELKSKGRAGELTTPPGSTYLGKSGNYQFIRIDEPKAASILCSGTQWCVANQDTAKKYLNYGLLYLVYKDGVRSYLIHYESGQFMDVYDERVSDEVKVILVNHLEEFTGRGFTSDAELAYWYAVNIIKGRFPEGESAIMQSPRYAYYYALGVINGRFPEAESVIMRSPEFAYYYVLNIIKGRWLEAEPVIMRSPEFAYYYALYVVKGRWLEAESIIMQSPEFAYYYAKRVIKGRWLEAEPIIKKDDFYWQHYKKIFNL